MKELGKNKISGENIYLWEVDSLENIELPPFPTDCFGLLLINNKATLNYDEFNSAAQNLLDNGLVNIDFFGKDCQKLCAEMDRVVTTAFPNETYTNVVLTTAHEGATFAECLWHFLYVSFRADQYQNKSYAQIILKLGILEEIEELINLVHDQSFLYQKVKGYIPKEFE